MVAGSREGGKAKPLKSAKKASKEMEEDEIAFRNKQKADEKARKEMALKAGKGGPLGAGLKKSSGAKK